MTQMRLLRSFLPIFMLTAAALPVQAESEKTIVSLPAENFGFLPFYIAQDQKLFEQQGLVLLAQHRLADAEFHGLHGSILRCLPPSIQTGMLKPWRAS